MPGKITSYRKTQLPLTVMFNMQRFLDAGSVTDLQDEQA